MKINKSENNLFTVISEASDRATVLYKWDKPLSLVSVEIVVGS